MGSFVKSDQVIQDLLNTLGKNTTTAQQLKEALLRETNCDYTQQIVSSLDSGVGRLPDAVRSLKQDSGNTALQSAKRYFLNDKATPINTSKLKFVFPTDNEGSIYQTLPLHQMQSRDLITSYKSLDPAYTLTSSGEIRNPTDFTYIVNVKLSMIVYDGQSVPGLDHPTPTFNINNASIIFNLTTRNTTSTPIGLKLSFTPYEDADEVIEQKYGGFSNYVRGHTIAGFKKTDLQGSYVFFSSMPDDVENIFNSARFNLVLGQACCTFNGREQHVGFFKELPAGNNLIDSTNYIDVICLGKTRVAT